MSDYNFLAPGRYRFILGDDTFKDVNYTVVKANIPGVSAPVAQPLRHRNSGLPVQGDSQPFEDLSIDFIIDEDMGNYKKLFNEIRRRKVTDELLDLDAQLEVLSSHNNVVARIQFYNLVPTALSAVLMASDATDTEYLTANAVFEYTNYDFLEVN